jgi:predicted RNA-binding protein YlqC (UPF0109 family)
METFLDYVVKGLVDRPDAVTITPSERNGMTVYELRVHPTDMGKIIGRQGATINAIRALLLVGSAKRGLRCALEVIDEENPEGGSHPRESGDSGGGERHHGGSGHRGERRPRGGGGGRDRGRRSGGERRGTFGGARY